jgi:hypothetical protein
MHLLDTDVMVDILAGYAPALEWLTELDEEEVGISGLVVMELMVGCRNKQEMERLQRQLEPYRVYWPTGQDCERALTTFPQAHLSHEMGILDALIGQCAVGLRASLCTFNVKHFRAISSLTTKQPYIRRAGRKNE